MILTIALNPNVIRKINIDGLQVDSVNQSISDDLSVGDCGIYSAYIMKVMQGDPYVMGFSGGIGGRFIKNFLDKNRIKSDFLQSDHETQTNLILHDIVNDTITTIVSHNEVLEQRDFINIKHKLHHHLDEGNIVTITGNDQWAAKIIKEIHLTTGETKKLVIGVEGEGLVECVDYKLHGLVLDDAGLKQFGLSMPTEVPDFEKIHEFQKEKKIKYLLVKGQYEIFGFTKNKICKVHFHSKDTIYPIIKSMILGGLAIAVKRDYPFELIMKLVGSIANGCSIDEYPFVISRKEIDSGLKHRRLYEIFNHRNGYLLGEGINE